MKFATKTIHAGQPSEPETGALVAPIFQTSTYEQEAPGQDKGFSYSRTNNPTRQRLEAVLAALEGVQYAAAFASGLAAENAILQAYLRPGDEIIIPLDVYGGTYRILNKVYQPIGVVIRQIDTGDLKAVEAAINKKTRLVWIEIAHQSAAADQRHRGDLQAGARQRRAGCGRQHFRHALLPAAVRAGRGHRGAQRDEISRRPLRHDSRRGSGERRRRFRADQVPAKRHRRRAFALRLLAHDARHQDARAENAAARGKRHRHRQRAERPSAGAARLLPGPCRASGARHCPATDERIRRHGFLRAGWNDGRSGFASFRRGAIFALGESLGGVKALICHPATMTHASIPAEARAELGLSDTLIRLSPGCESAEDLVEDLLEGLAQIESARAAKKAVAANAR